MEESYEVVEIKHVHIQSGENVYVTWAEDPTNFRVCPLCVDVGFQGWFSIGAGRPSLLLSMWGRQHKLPSAEASKRAQYTSPGQYTPCIKGIVKTP